jgi:hypothetical protein
MRDYVSKDYRTLLLERDRSPKRNGQPDNACIASRIGLSATNAITAATTLSAHAISNTPL